MEEKVSADDSEELSVLKGQRACLPHPTTLHQFFSQQIILNPEKATAHGLYFRDEYLPYNELDTISNKVATTLVRCMQRKGLLPPRNDSLLVAVDVAPSPQQIICLLAVLKTGGAYMPVDSSSAINRVRYILNECSPSCVLADGDSVFIKDSDTLWSQYCVINIHELCSDVRDSPVETILQSANPSDPAAVIYTSGSTGIPKGVILSHQTIINRLHWGWLHLPFQGDEVGCYKTSLLFVDSAVEIFSNLLQLVPLAIAPKDIPSDTEAFIVFLTERHVTRLTMVPSMLRNILNVLSLHGSTNRLSSLRLCMSNSETLTPQLALKFFQLFPGGVRLMNLYGSTETMADVTYEHIRSPTDLNKKTYNGKLSIGVPLLNSVMYVVDNMLRLVPVGEVGEICVSGLNVASGYVDGKSGPHFIDNPFSEGGVLYRTGDFGRVVNGRVIYEGRRDFQVKIRGKRANITEIERVIQEFKGVDKAVVLCHQFNESTIAIVAHFTRSLPVHIDELKEWCLRHLPSYMVPRLIEVKDIPLQKHTGKTDRVALKRVYEKCLFRQSSKELAVLDEKTKKALHILAINLNLPANAVDMKLSFFDLGGNSVSMISTIVHMKEHGLSIPIEVFSTARTVQDIIDHACFRSRTLSESMRTEKYKAKRLKEVEDNHKMVDVLTDSFIEKEPLDVLLGVTKEEFLPFARSIYQEATKGDLSIIVVDEAGQVVGGDFLFDYFLGVEVEHHQSMAPIMAILDQIERPVKEELRRQKTAPLLFNYCLCVHKDLPHADQVQICHLIEGTVLQVAREHEFRGVVTTNTNPATQDICEHFYSYQLLTKFLVKDFEFNGRKVFSHAEDDYYIKSMVKFI